MLGPGVVPPPGNSLTSRVQLAVTGWLSEPKRGLHVVLFQGQRNGSQVVWHRSAETEQLPTPVADPRWMRTFVLDYHFEQTQPLKFTLMSGGVELDELICDLATIIGSRGQTFTKQFDRPMGSMGGLSVMAEEFRNQQAPTEKMIWYIDFHYPPRHL